MIRESLVPGDPLAFIQDCDRRRQVLWTYHVNMRLARRSISREEVLDAVDGYQLVESYPEDKYLPSYLVLARAPDANLHILLAVDVEHCNVRVVTVYRPGPEDWEPDLKTRRTPP